MMIEVFQECMHKWVLTVYAMHACMCTSPLQSSLQPSLAQSPQSLPSLGQSHPVTPFMSHYTIPPNPDLHVFSHYTQRQPTQLTNLLPSSAKTHSPIVGSALLIVIGLPSSVKACIREDPTCWILLHAASLAQPSFSRNVFYSGNQNSPSYSTWSSLPLSRVLGGWGLALPRSLWVLYMYWLFPFVISLSCALFIKLSFQKKKLKKRLPYIPSKIYESTFSTLSYKKSDFSTH